MTVPLAKTNPVVTDSLDSGARVLLICDHPVLGKAIKAGLADVAAVDVVCSKTDDVSAATVAATAALSDLAIVAQIQSNDGSEWVTPQLVTRLPNWAGTPPVLAISEEPAVPTPLNTHLHYLRFPFRMDVLHERVVEILSDCKGAADRAQEAVRSRVMVVEDEIIVAADLSRTLVGLGYDVVGRYAYAEEAVEAVSDAQPDVILMDIHLRGEMDGITAAHIVQAEQDVPVIFLTAHSDAATLDRAQRTAPYGYVLKPYDDRELHSAIRVALYRAQAEREIRERERWLRTVLRSIGDGIVASDAQGRVVFLNPVAETLLNRDWDEVIHQPLDTVLSAATGSASDASEASETQGREVLHLARGSRERVVEQTRSGINDDRGEPWGEIRALRDVTEAVRSRDLLHQQAAELAERNDELTAFAHTVAHDIKDPLNVIRGYAELLGSDDMELDEVQRARGLETIVGYSKRLSNIVDELLLLATVRDADIQQEPLAMPQIVARAEERLTYLQSRKGATIRLVTEAWPVALGYPSWVEEVWVNFLSNGMKYGGTPPVLEVGADVAGCAVRCWVRDNGPGIELSDQARLFTPFSRLHKVRTTGQGLGLSIVRRIVTRLGGEVGVESQPNHGSTFYFTLPAAHGTG